MSAGLGLAFGARAGRLSVELWTTTFLPESHDSGTPGAGGTFWLLTVGGAVCGALIDAAALELAGCGGFEVEGMHASGYGVSQPGSGVAGWGAPSAAVLLAIRLLPRLWFVARLDGIAALSRPTFRLEDVGPVYQVSPVSGRLGVGVEVRF